MPVKVAPETEEEANTFVTCICGRTPEVNAALKENKFSLSCRCGGRTQTYVICSDDEEWVRNQWNQTAASRRGLQAQVQSDLLDTN